MQYIWRAAIALALVGCSSSKGRSEGGGDFVERGRADMTDATGRGVGTVVLQRAPHGTLLTADLANLPSGTHAVHIHSVGKCESNFESAGEHFNPGGKSHGYKNPNGQHAGDLPNIHTTSGGNVRIDLLVDDLEMQSGDQALFGGDGSSIVIHSFADDYATDPAGGSGARIACGVIRR
ncbi:MAG: superoxide dismutase family protein [Anaerolineae bacterium]|nr:superoxide dismutase family protein [Gemmatimonadaceae bacterium]